MFDQFADLSERLATGDQHTEDLDMLINISKEMRFIKEIKDIRDELHVISAVLYDQERVLVDLDSALRAIKGRSIVELTDSDDTPMAPGRTLRKYHSRVESVRRHLEVVRGLDKQAEKTYLSVSRITLWAVPRSL